MMTNISPISEFVWRNKYALNNESYEDFYTRVAKGLSSSDPDSYGIYYDMISNYRFLPAGRILTAIGSEERHAATLMNCFVSSDIHDSIDSIMDVAKESALVQKLGGGIGYNFSFIRPKNDPIKSIGGLSSGPVSFMHIFDAVCRTISSAGGRRGAQMAMLRVDHPDIKEFINAKTAASYKEMPLQNFNLSIQITDKFMQAVESDDTFDLVFNGKVYNTINARDLWNEIADHAYQYSEPGIFFIDRANEMNITNYAETISCTNPCGEQPLPHNGACNLGSLNLTQYVKDPFTEKASFDYELFTNDIKYAIKALDHVLDLTNFPQSVPLDNNSHNAFYETAMKTRRVGLGVTGYADMLIMMNLIYGKPEALELTERILFKMKLVSLVTSIELARLYGPMEYTKSPEDREKYLSHKYITSLREQGLDQISYDTIVNDIRTHGIRNSHRLSIAPTGTISLIANNVSSSLEPVFDFSYDRKIRRGEEDVHYCVEDYAFKLYKETHDGNDPIGPAWVNTFDITPEEHIATQAMFQKYIDSSVSKTINLSEDIKVSEIQRIYTLAYKSGLKGTTIFRPSNVYQPVLSKTEKDKTTDTITIEQNSDVKSNKDNLTIVIEPNSLYYRASDKVVHSFKLAKDTDLALLTKFKPDPNKYPIWITTSLRSNGTDLLPYQLFLNTKNVDGHNMSFIGRLFSAVLRKAYDTSDLDYISVALNEFMSTSIPNEVYWDNEDIYYPSYLSGLGYRIRDIINNLHLSKTIRVDFQSDKTLCPKCGNQTIAKFGCSICPICGYSSCTSDS